MRTLGLAVTFVLAAGCAREKPAPQPEPAAPPTAAPAPTGPAIDRVRAWAGPGVTVTPWRGGPVGDLELFLLTRPRDQQQPRIAPRLGVMVIPGAPLWATGKPAMKVVLDRGVKEPAELARIAALVLGGGVTVVKSPAELPATVPAAERALVTAPVVNDGVLEYWGTCCEGEPRPARLMRTRLALASLVYEAADASHILALAAAASQPAKAAPAAGAPKKK
jgi:hypothetical protein